MFEGIVLGLGRVVGVEERPGSRGLLVDLAGLAPEISLGGSVAINGTCLTSVGHDGTVERFDVVAETLSRTNLGTLKAGDRVNVELPLRWGGEIHGHLVQGHVDARGRVIDRSRQGDDVRLRIGLPPGLVRFVVEKGSVAVDGVSLTVVSVDHDESAFEVAVIPYTLSVTTLGFRHPGDEVNLEVDHQARLIQVAVDAAVEPLHREMSLLRERVAALEGR